MLSEEEKRFQHERPHRTVEIFGISPQTDRKLWEELQHSDDRQDAAPQGWATIEPDDEPTTPMEPLPWLDVEIVDLRQNITRLENRIDRHLSMLQEDLERLETGIDDLERDVVATSSICDGVRSFGLLLFGFAAAMFVAGAVSGSDSQKDALAENGLNLAAIGITATAIGCTINRVED